MDKDFYHSVLNTTTDGIYFTDMDRRITFWNNAATKLSGYEAKEVLGKQCLDNILCHEDEFGQVLCKERCPLEAVLQDGLVREINVSMRHKLGHKVPITVRASAMFDENKEIVGAVEVFSENNETKTLRSQMDVLRKELLTDALTGVGNRRYAETSIQHFDLRSEETNAPFAVLFVDIDDFKFVNDTYGHPVGDIVLSRIARTLKQSLRTQGVICRWGGDEFVIFTPSLTSKKLHNMAERIRTLLERTVVRQYGNIVQVTASFGGAISRPHEYCHDVILRADRQLYLSKQSGRNRTFIDKA